MLSFVSLAKSHFVVLRFCSKLDLRQIMLVLIVHYNTLLARLADTSD